MMPTGHQWTLKFDRIVCRDCYAERRLSDDAAMCKGAARIRPMAGFRQEFKPDLSAHPQLNRARKRWQAGERV